MLQSTSSQRVRHNLVTEQHRDIYVQCASVSDIKPKVPRISHFKLRLSRGFPWWSSGDTSALQCRECGFDPWLGSQDPTCSVAKNK